MDDKKGTNSTVGIAALLVIVGVVGGQFWLPKPLRPARPDEGFGGESQMLGDRWVPARLWQDPLEAVRAFRKGGSRKEQQDSSRWETVKSNFLLQGKVAQTDVTLSVAEIRSAEEPPVPLPTRLGNQLRRECLDRGSFYPEMITSN